MQNDQKNITNGKSEISHSFNLIQTQELNRLITGKRRFILPYFESNRTIK